MDESDAVVKQATEFLLQQEGQHRQLVHRLQHQQLQLDTLQQQLHCSRTQGEVHAHNGRLFEELQEDRRRLQSQNASLLEKVSALQAEFEAERRRLGEVVNRQNQQLEDTRQSTGRGQRQLLFAPTGVTWAGDGSQFSRIDESKSHPFAMSTVAPPAPSAAGHVRDLLDLVSIAVNKFEQVRLRDDLYDGMVQVTEVGIDALMAMCRCCARLDPAVQPESQAWQQRLQVAQQRCAEDIREKRATHRLLKRALREQGVRRELPEALSGVGGLDPQALAATLSHLQQQQQHAGWEQGGFQGSHHHAAMAAREAEERLAALRQEVAAQQSRLQTLEQQLGEAGREGRGQTQQLLELMDSKLEGLKVNVSHSTREEAMQVELAQLRAEVLSLAEERAALQRREDRLAVECQAQAVHARHAEERFVAELREAHRVSAAVEQRLRTAEQSLQEETHASHDLRARLQQEQEKHATSRGKVEALVVEVKRLREEKGSFAEDRRLASALPAMAGLREAEAEAQRWREGFSTVSHFCESIRAAVQLGVASLTAHMEGSTAARVQVPALEPFAHDAMTPSGLACVCRSVQDLLAGYIDTVNAFVRSLHSGANTLRQREAERRQQVGVVLRRLATVVNGLCRDYVRFRGEVKATMAEGKRSLAETMHTVVLQWREAEAQHAHRWQEERSELLARYQAQGHELHETDQALAQERQSAANLRAQLEGMGSRHQASLQGIDTGYHRRTEDFSLRLEQSQTSLIDGDRALVENDRLRKELEAKTKEVHDATLKFDQRSHLHQAELSALQEQCTALLRRLCEAERENGILHRKCVVKEEECNRLFTAVKAQRRPSPVRRSSQPPFSLDGTLEL